MNTLIVIYELPAITFYRTALIQKLKDYGYYAFVTSNSCVIKTWDQPDTVRDELSATLKGEGKIYVGVTSAPAAWIGINEEISNWLKNEL